MQAGPRKNMERMEEVVKDMDYQCIQQFITDAPWSFRDVIDEVACQASGIFGGDPNTCLIIDESSFQKKGDKSVGVARQYMGRLGKVDNGQVAVFAALGCQQDVTLTDVRLYLPKEWSNDSQRCEEAKIPEDQREYKTKLELALEMVDHAREMKLEYQWICADGLYGQS